MIVTIDPKAGFCFGVEKAVNAVEENISTNESLFCLGEIVHNGEEVSRLNKLGLQSIDKATFNELKNSTLLVRAHGEPPETYTMAAQNNVKIIDSTCPIVLKLQKRILLAWNEMQAMKGQVAILGKKNHPEVIGLNGQTGYKAIILHDMNDIDQIDFNKPLRLFAQTTIHTKIFNHITSDIKSRMKSGFIAYNTICKQVSNREPALIDFCKKNDVIVFVSGKNSSNGKALYEVCKSANEKSYHISSVNEMNKAWFKNIQRVGISGATSTPAWLMEKVREEILSQ
jgi:4-hydroxy-3-methylbut-2-enyl diphosphate reductase